MASATGPLGSDDEGFNHQIADTFATVGTSVARQLPRNKYVMPMTSTTASNRERSTWLTAVDT